MKPDALECREVQAHLPLYTGGDLEAPWCDLVALHLERCSSCAAESERLRGALRNLAVLSPIDARPIDVWPSVRAQLQREGRLQPRTPAAPRTLPRWRQVAVRGALAAGVAALAWIAWDAAPPRSARSAEDAGSSVADGAAAAQPVESLAEAPQLQRGLQRVAPGESRMGEWAVTFPSPSSGTEAVRGQGALASERVLGPHLPFERDLR